MKTKKTYLKPKFFVERGVTVKTTILDNTGGVHTNGQDTEGPWDGTEKAMFRGYDELESNDTSSFPSLW